MVWAQRFIIKDSINEDEYKWALKTIKKAIKNLRKGNGDEVFDPERYEEIMYRDRWLKYAKSRFVLFKEYKRAICL